MQGNGRLLSLLIAHVVCGLLCLGLLASPLARTDSGMASLPLVPFYAIVFCQVSMLGFWAATSPMAWWWRLIGLVAGCIYLDGLLVVAGVGHSRIPVASIASSVTTGLLLLARRPRVRLIRLSPPPVHGKGLRFSIRGLILLTLVAALLIFGSEGLGDSYLAILVAWVSCFVVVGLASPWAALGPGPPSSKCLLVLAVSAALGALFICRIYRADVPRAIYGEIYSAFLLQAALLIVSLLEVRSCGYHLTEKPEGESVRRGVSPPLDVERMLRDMGS